MVFSGLKEKKQIAPLNFACSTLSKYQILVQTGNFDLLDQILLKRVFPSEKGKSEQHHRILDIRN